MLLCFSTLAFPALWRHTVSNHTTPEDGCSMFMQYVRKYYSSFVAPHTRRPKLSTYNFGVKYICAVLHFCPIYSSSPTNT